MFNYGSWYDFGTFECFQATGWNAVLKEGGVTVLNFLFGLSFLFKEGNRKRITDYHLCLPASHLYKLVVLLTRSLSPWVYGLLFG